MVWQMAESYPGEPMALLKSEFGHMYCMRVLSEDRPEYVKIMLATQLSGFEIGEDMRAIFGPLLGSGVFAAEGELWKISDFDPFDRHSLQDIAQIKNRLHKGYADGISRFAMDASTEFLFGHNTQTLSAGLPYPFYVPLTAASAPEHRSIKFATALKCAAYTTSTPTTSSSLSLESY
ncbi:hypothetical protein DFH09DRAFT_1315601 [Mycena vulgaris]|nr:hypothetical protein DFH09DRAFT_1315601 [Mycena vulgaris]